MIAQVILRQNYLVFWMSLALSTPYSLYVIPAINTLGFLVVFVSMATWPPLTLESMRGQKCVCVCVCVCACVVCLLLNGHLLFIRFYKA